VTIPWEAWIMLILIIAAACGIRAQNYLNIFFVILACGICAVVALVDAGT